MTLDTSIAGKITLGYYVLGGIIFALSLFTFMQLYQLEHKVAAGERISGFLNDTLEARRFEKNFFLYGQAGDAREGLRYVASARRLLAEHGEDFLPVSDARELARLGDDLGDYAALLQRLLGDGDGGAALEQRIRAVGNRVVSAAEEMAANERRLLQASLTRSRSVLLVSVIALVAVGIVMGRLLSRRVVRTLQQLEESMDRVAVGEGAALRIDSHDREVVSLTRAFEHMLAELESKQAHLVRSQKLAALGTLLSGVAHELNNPLSNISTSCQILLEELEDADPATRHELLGQIDEQTERARVIVRSLLEFARERPFRKERLPLGPLVDDTLRFVRGEVGRAVAVRADVPPELQVYADKQRLQQVLLNLIKNALAAVEAGGEVTVAARPVGADWRTHGRCPGGQGLEIEVRDTGAGIDPAILPRIFDPFFTTKEVGRGAGLGLAIAHEIVEEHGGCLEVESQPGNGTAFYVRLPAADQAAGRGED